MMMAVWVRSCMFRYFHIGRAEIRSSSIMGDKRQTCAAFQPATSACVHRVQAAPRSGVPAPPAGQKPNCGRNSKFMIMTVSPIFIIFIHLLKGEFEKHLGKQHQQSL